MRARVAVASAVSVDREAAAEPEERGEEETARRRVWEERCSGVVGRVRQCGRLVLVGDRTGMDENSLHRTDVVPVTRSIALRMKTAGRCMECSVLLLTQARCGCVCGRKFRTGLSLWTRGASAYQGKPIRSHTDASCNAQTLIYWRLCPRNAFGMPSY